jgi:hypothetical protein
MDGVRPAGRCIQGEPQRAVVHPAKAARGSITMFAMKMKVIALLLFLNLGFPLAPCALAGERVWYHYNGHFYALSSTWQTWQDAEAEARSIGAHLVAINDAAENAWLTQTFGYSYTRDHQGEAGHSIAWIGLHYDLADWIWSSGDVLGFTSYYSLWPEGGVHAYLHCAGHPSLGTWNAHDFHDNPGGWPRGIIEWSGAVEIVEPSISINRQPTGSVEVSFAGVLQESDDLVTWTDVDPQPASPAPIPTVSDRKFFRTRSAYRPRID